MGVCQIDYLFLQITDVLVRCEPATEEADSRQRHSTLVYTQK
jgi:hypothetical protein